MQIDTTTAGDEFLGLGQFMQDNLAQFTPFAYYDKHLDCIRVQIRDCSVTEHRLSRLFTILEANHIAAGFASTVGFTIKGARHLFNEMGLEVDRAWKLADLINEIVREYPHAAVSTVREFLVSKEAQQTSEMVIDFAEAAA